jgi:LuxR family quorum sensing-dependent transcriptional regulator
MPDIDRGASRRDDKQPIGPGRSGRRSTTGIVWPAIEEALTHTEGGRLMRQSSVHGADAFKSAAQGVVSALAKARDVVELDKIFVARIECLGYENAGYLRVFGEGRFHRAKCRFGSTPPGWAERYQNKQNTIDDLVTAATFRSSGAFTLHEVAAPSRAATPMLADSRTDSLFDGLCAPIRAAYDEVGFVLLGADHLIEPSDYERFLLQGMCEAYARAGLMLLPSPAVSPPLTRRESECLRWVAAGRSDPQIGMILGLSSNTVHAHVEAAKTKLNANSRAQLVIRALMAGILRSGPS